MTSYKCPACGSSQLVVTDDEIRNIGIIKCDECGECYAYSIHDLYEIGADNIMREWRGSYEYQARLVGGNDD